MSDCMSNWHVCQLKTDSMCGMCLRMPKLYIIDQLHQLLSKLRINGGVILESKWNMHAGLHIKYNYRLQSSNRMPEHSVLRQLW